MLFHGLPVITCIQIPPQSSSVIQVHADINLLIKKAELDD